MALARTFVCDSHDDFLHHFACVVGVTYQQVFMNSQAYIVHGNVVYVGYLEFNIPMFENYFRALTMPYYPSDRYYLAYGYSL